MNAVTPGRADDGEEEELMRRLISEAGDPAVAPRDEYVSGLRSLVLDRLGPPRRTARWRTRLLVGSGMAAAVLVAVVLALVLSRPANAWAQVARALQGRPWVHTRTLGPDGKPYGEAWFSPQSGISAVRHGPHVEYHDRALRTFIKYVPDEGVIYRLPENTEPRSQEVDFYQQLLDPKGPTKSPIAGMDIVAQSRRDIVEGGRGWVEIELTLKVIAGDRRELMRFRVDPATKLPHSVVFESREGQGTTLFDYPDRGPADIYDLGAPRTARIVDRVPADDLDRVLAGLKAGRVRFDDYRGIYDWGDGMNVKRIWRKGRKWRVEQILPVAGRPAPFPRDADAAWWKAHQDDFEFMVQAICDGERICYYQPEGNPYALDAKRPTPLKRNMTQEINPSDDPFMPWPDMFPEHISRPSVWQPTHDREFLLDAHPADGPPGTIRLRVRDTRASDPGRPDLYKLWISPAASYIAVRSEMSVFEGGPTPQKLAYVETTVMEGLAQAPSGAWYPTRVRRKTTTFPNEQVWTFHLDFDVPIPDELFRPLE
jgi:hypothetical protein